MTSKAWFGLAFAAGWLIAERVFGAPLARCEPVRYVFPTTSTLH